MTTSTITLEIAKQHLRVLHTDDDAMITRYIAQAQAICLDYIKQPADWFPPDAVKANLVELATLMQLSQLYDDRNVGESDNPNVAMGYLPPQVTAILHRMRDPAVA
jgi:uncharacterized phage protein (predicted DNA packaging)